MINEKNLKKRQYKYEVGSVVEFTDKFKGTLWYDYEHKKRNHKLGVVYKIGENYWCNPILYVRFEDGREYTFTKGYAVKLCKNETIIMESL